MNDQILQQQIDEMQRLAIQPGRGVFRALKSLEKEALSRGEDALLGFVYFHFSNAHFSRNESPAAHKYLRLAVRHLIRSDDAPLLARSFNLFALDAMYTGCYDIAQNFFHMAYSLVQGEKDSFVGAILDGNIGGLLTETGDFEGSIRRTRRTLKLLRLHSEDPLSDQNLAVGLINIGLNSVHAGKIADAEKSLARAERILVRTEVEETIQLTHLLLCAMLAFAKGEKEETRKEVQRIAARVAGGTLYNDFIYDLYRFCRKLLDEGGDEYADMLLSAVRESDESGASVYRRMLISQLDVKLCAKKGDPQTLTERFAKQHALSLQHVEAQKQMYLYSVDMMMLIDELREEQMRFRRENEQLRIEAETDSLTGLPNRYAMGLAIERAHQRMREAGKSLGIGIIDIDAFKQYNDLYGHAQGDQCLRLVADALKQVAKEEQLFVARYGGDEFVLLYEDHTDEEIRRIASSIYARMPVRVSHGFSNVIPDEDVRLFELFSEADAEMYREKKGHR